MRFGILYLMVFLFGLTGFTVMISKAPVQEELIVGTWEETKWKYEKNGDEEVQTYQMGKEDAVGGQPYRIHQAETWTFLKGGKLNLLCKGNCVQATWSIKGRGNILQIRYSDNYTESYQLTELATDRMELNYECDAQAKGIAKLNFKKIGG